MDKCSVLELYRHDGRMGMRSKLASQCQVMLVIFTCVHIVRIQRCGVAYVFAIVLKLLPHNDLHDSRPHHVSTQKMHDSCKLIYTMHSRAVSVTGALGRISPETARACSNIVMILLPVCVY